MRPATGRHLRSTLDDLERTRLTRQFGSSSGTAIASVPGDREVEIDGEVRIVTIPPPDSGRCLEATVTDGSGDVHAVWHGDLRPDGIWPGAGVRLVGVVTPTSRERRMSDPAVLPLPTPHVH